MTRHRSNLPHYGLHLPLSAVRRHVVACALAVVGCQARPSNPEAVPTTRAPADVGVVVARKPPSATLPADAIAQVSAGVDSTCILLGDGRIACVGAHVGMEPFSDNNVATPRLIEGISPAVQIEAGDGLWCARSSDGTVHCWRALGPYDDEADVARPAPVSEVRQATDLAVRGIYGCAREPDSVVCWPDFGRIPLASDQAAWALVSTRRSAGYGMEVCLRANGRPCVEDPKEDRPATGPDGGGVVLHAWRDSTYLWYDKRCWIETNRALECTPSLSNPIEVPKGARVSATGGYWCWIMPDGAVSCGGSNLYGQLGRSGVDHLLKMTPVVGLPPIAELSTGGRHVCALARDRSVWCWGRASEGQLALAVPQRTTSPVQADVAGGTELTAGRGRTCVRTSSGVRCSGFAEGPYCGRATLDLPIPEIPADARVVASRDRLCTHADNGAVRCTARYPQVSVFGTSEFGPRRADVRLTEDLGRGRQVVMLDEEVCVLRNDNSVDCEDEDVWRPARKLVELVGGTHRICGLRVDGKIECTSIVDMKGAVQPIRFPSPPVQIAAHGLDLCARLKSGAVQCFAIQAYGTLLTHTMTGLPARAASVRLGDELGCVLGVGGDVACWPLEDGTNIYVDPQTFVAEPIALPEPAVSLVVGGDHACAQLKSGALYCWGGNTDGQLGDGTAQCYFSPVDRTAGLMAFGDEAGG